mgnify:CR=1 FL=1
MGNSLLLKEVSISDYISDDEIEIEIPVGSNIDTIQIDTTNSRWAKYFNISISNEEQTLTVCKLENQVQMDMMLFGAKSIMMEKIKVSFKPNVNSQYYDKAMIVYGDEIIIRIIGSNEEEEGEDRPFYFFMGDF